MTIVYHRKLVGLKYLTVFYSSFIILVPKKLLRHSFTPLLLIFFGKVSNPLLPRRLFQTPDFWYTCLVLFLEPFSKSDADINRDNNKSKKLLEKLKNSGESRKTDFNLVSNEDLKSMEFA